MDFLDGIDHPVVAVRDLDAACSQYRRLGFAVTPPGAHVHRGVGNACVMFATNYIELRTDLAGGRIANGVAQFLANGHDGFFGCVFRPAVSADNAYAGLLSKGVNAAEQPRESIRDFELPSGTIPLKFKLFALEKGTLPGLLSVVVCEHLTHEEMRPAQWLVHPNGATSIRAIVAVVTERAKLIDHAARIFGAGRIEQHGATDIVRVGAEQRLYAISPERARDLGFPTFGEGAQIVAMEIHAPDLDKVAALLQENGVTHKWMNAGCIHVAAEEAQSATILFSNAPADFLWK